jgi:pilus assembly protein CpaC
MAGKLFGMNILAALDAAENIGLVTTLAQPNLTALSGETGEFLAGGEFPIPISSTLGTVSIEFKRIMASRSATHPRCCPTAASRCACGPKCPELTSDGAVTLNGYTIPRSPPPGRNLGGTGFGQSIMIGGLLRNTSSNSVQSCPARAMCPWGTCSAPPPTSAARPNW